jgi:hypothetical protein
LSTRLWRPSECAFFIARPDHGHAVRQLPAVPLSPAISCRQEASFGARTRFLAGDRYPLLY